MKVISLYGLINFFSLFINVHPDGSFFLNAKKYNSTLPTDATLESVFVLSVPGVSRPADLLLGYYSTSNYNSASINGSRFADEFGIKWNTTSVQIGTGGDKESATQAENIKSLYKDKLQFLSLTDFSEIVFITIDSDLASAYTKNFLLDIYGGNFVINEMPFTFANYNSSLYSPASNIENNDLSRLPKVAVLQDSYTTINFGFSFLSNCPKVPYYSVRMFQQNNTMAAYINTTFGDILANWYNQFKQLGNAFYAYTGKEYMAFDKKSLNSNRTLTIQLINHFLADYEMFYNETYPQYMEDLIKFIPDQKISNINHLYDFKKFLTYQASLFSNVYNYLTIAPFIRFMIQQFNVKIMKDTSVKSYVNKLNWFTVDTNVIAALYKILNYDPNNDKNMEEYKDLPLIDYGYTLSFELHSYLPKGKTEEEFYILMRENYKIDSPVFVLKSDIFSNLLNLVMITPDYTVNERAWFCGTSSTG